MSTAKHVFVLDDDPLDQMIVKRALNAIKLSSMKLSLADNISSALSTVNDPESRPPDVMFIDLNLGSESGFDFIAKARADEILANKQIFVLSSSCYQGDFDRAAELGTNGYLVKPDCFDGYVDILRKIVG